MNYPVALNIRGKECLVAGGGIIALRKIKRLIRSGARVRVVSPRVEAEIAGLVSAGAIKHVKRVFRRADLKGAFLVIAATNDAVVNAKICTLASLKSIPANSITPAKQASFSNMAEFDSGGLLVAVSSSGKNVKKAVAARDRIEKFMKGGKKS